jgi:hypothetical protein
MRSWCTGLMHLHAAGMHTAVRMPCRTFCTAGHIIHGRCSALRCKNCAVLGHRRSCFTKPNRPLVLVHITVFGGHMLCWRDGEPQQYVLMDLSAYSANCCCVCCTQTRIHTTGETHLGRSRASTKRSAQKQWTSLLSSCAQATDKLLHAAHTQPVTWRGLTVMFGPSIWVHPVSSAWNVLTTLFGHGFRQGRPHLWATAYGKWHFLGLLQDVWHVIYHIDCHAAPSMDQPPMHSHSHVLCQHRQHWQATQKSHMFGGAVQNMACVCHTSG